MQSFRMALVCPYCCKECALTYLGKIHLQALQVTDAQYEGSQFATPSFCSAQEQVQKIQSDARWVAAASPEGCQGIGR